MRNKIITTAALVIVCGLSLGSSCQKVADDLGKATSTVAQGFGMEQDDAEKLGNVTRVVGNTWGQNWNKQDIGESFAVSLTADPGVNELAALNTYVTNVGITIASVTGKQDLDFTFGVIEDDAVNAVSSPGGFIFVTRGALAQMQDESELAAVLAHEIAHVVKDHSWKTIEQKRGVNLVRGLAEAATGEYIAKANYDTTALGRFIAREMASDHVDLKSHPPTEKRVAALKSLGATHPQGQKNAERFKRVMGRP
jgi:predicted Zn-dependent protease